MLTVRVCLPEILMKLGLYTIYLFVIRLIPLFGESGKINYQGKHFSKICISNAKKIRNIQVRVVWSNISIWF